MTSCHGARDDGVTSGTATAGRLLADSQPEVVQDMTLGREDSVWVGMRDVRDYNPSSGRGGATIMKKITYLEIYRLNTHFGLFGLTLVPPVTF